MSYITSLYIFFFHVSVRSRAEETASPVLGKASKGCRSYLAAPRVVFYVDVVALKNRHFANIPSCLKKQNAAMKRYGNAGPSHLELRLLILRIHFIYEHISTKDAQPASESLSSQLTNKTSWMDDETSSSAATSVISEKCRDVDAIRAPIFSIK